MQSTTKVTGAPKAGKQFFFEKKNQKTFIHWVRVSANSVLKDQSIFGLNRMSHTPLVPPELLDRVVNYFHPQRVILFGSHARGEANDGSDIDLLVILDNDAPREQLTLRAGWEARDGYNRAADVIPVRSDVYHRRAKIVGTLAYEAEIDGIAVYERD